MRGRFVIFEENKKNTEKDLKNVSSFIPEKLHVKSFIKLLAKQFLLHHIIIICSCVEASQSNFHKVRYEQVVYYDK